MRIRISKQNSELIDKLTNLFSFRVEGIIARIALASSLQTNKHFDVNEEVLISADGKDLRDERLLFGTSGDEKAYFPLYKAVLDQHYERCLVEEDFIKLFKRHLDFGLNKINIELEDRNLAAGEHVEYLMRLVNNGLQLIANPSFIPKGNTNKRDVGQHNGLVKLCLGHLEDGTPVEFKINDLNEFDSCNMAIAGMVGSGKTELVKDLLYQITLQSESKLKFIFFDYKGEGNAERLKSFLGLTNSEIVDLRKAPFELNPLSFIDLEDERAKSFNIKSFVDFVCAIASQIGPNQRHILQTVISSAFEGQAAISTLFQGNAARSYPTLSTIFEDLQAYYEENGLKPDSLYSIVSDLANNIFSSEPHLEKRIYERSLYINLPIELSDTLRQLCVFLTLKYLLAEFSSFNDTEPTDDRIKPLRYVVVIDEAHIYLKNRNASKALEDVLRILRSKGVMIIMLTQGQECMVLA
ncbi:MAG: DUF1832 domain-containing protein [Sphingobacteriales bacterium]|nr:MAG: DUF1832 domain-containing protein [Sphingobacteriales bacterium]